MKTNTILYSKLRNWYHLSALISQKAKGGLRAEASRSYLGVLWWVIEPVLYMSIFYILFVHLFHRGDENFIIFLLTGLTVWKWFAASVTNGSNSLMANTSLMNQVYLPKIIFPLTAIAMNTFKFLVIFTLFLIFLQFSSIQISFVWIFLPFLILTQLLLIIAVTCLAAGIIPFFPDLQVILQNIMMMFLFLSGIFFDINRMPESVRGYLMLNPMALLIMMYRKLIIKGIPPNWYELFSVILFSLVILLIALWLFSRFDRVYPKIIR